MLALSLLALVFLASSTHVANSRALGESNADALLLEKEYYRRAEIRGALMSALRGAANAEDAAAKIADVSALVKEELGQEGIEALVWCGIATEWELESLPGDMVREGKALPCPSCWDARSIVAGTCCIGDECRPDLANPCSLITAVDDKAGMVIGASGIRMNDAGETCVYPEVVAAAWKKAVLGASLYCGETGYAGVSFLPQGFEVRK